MNEPTVAPPDEDSGPCDGRVVDVNVRGRVVCADGGDCLAALHLLACPYVRSMWPIQYTRPSSPCR